MTAIKSFLKFLVLCYHLPFRWTFLFWAPLVVIAPLIPFIIDYNKVGFWDAMALIILYTPFLAYIKGGQDSIVADGLAQKLERRGTMIH